MKSLNVLLLSCSVFGLAHAGKGPTKWVPLYSTSYDLTKVPTCDNRAPKASSSSLVGTFSAPQKTHFNNIYVRRKRAPQTVQPTAYQTIIDIGVVVGPGGIDKITRTRYVSLDAIGQVYYHDTQNRPIRQVESTNKTLSSPCKKISQGRSETTVKIVSKNAKTGENNYITVTLRNSNGAFTVDYDTLFELKATSGIDHAFNISTKPAAALASLLSFGQLVPFRSILNGSMIGVRDRNDPLAVNRIK
ncbi:MAG TPA: hypothetical protein VM901_08525 [Bdellovibrionota bacterium]|nr:hypothetical protein [Bdellovibrionota bacterium]